MNELQELELKNFLYTFLAETVVKGMNKTPDKFAEFLKKQTEILFEKIKKYERTSNK